MKAWQTKNGCRIIKILSARSNVFLLIFNEKNIIIDTSPNGKWKALDKKLRDFGISKIDYLILTHTHYDHAENAVKIKDNYQAKVIVHRAEEPNLNAGNNTIPKGTNFATKFLVNIVAPKFLKLFSYAPCNSDILVDDRFDLTDFGFPAYIIHTPGHSIGSMSLIVDEEIAIVGDAIFGVFPWSVFPPFADDVPELINSWGKLLSTNCVIFLPSHGTKDSRKLLEKQYLKRIH